MSDETQTLVTAITALVIVLGQILLVLQQMSNGRQLVKYTHEVNSKLDKFVALVGDDAFRRGEKSAEDAAEKKAKP